MNEGELCVIGSREGVLDYKFQGADYSAYLKKFREQYEEALHIVELENMKLDHQRNRDDPKG